MRDGIDGTWPLRYRLRVRELTNRGRRRNTLPAGRQAAGPASSSINGVFRNSLILASALPIVYGVGLASTAYAARALGPTGLGSVQFVVATGSYLLVASDLGLPLLGTRGVAAEPLQRAEWLSKILTARLSLTGLALLVLTMLVIVAGGTRAIAFAAFAPLLPLTALSIRWYFQGRETMAPIAVSDALNAIVAFVFLTMFVHSEGDAPIAILSTSAGAAGAAAWLWFRHAADRQVLEIKPDLRSVRPTILAALPLAASSILVSVYYNMDSVIIGLLRPTSDVGLYGGAYRIILAMLAAAWAFFNALLPAMTRNYAVSEGQFRSVMTTAIRMAVTVAVPLAVGAVLTAEGITTLVLGPAFRSAASAFAILVVNVSVIVVSGTAAMALFATRAEVWYLRSVAAGAVVNVILNLVLIPLFGIEGAAAATLAAEATVFVAILVRLPHAASAVLRSLWKPVIASAPMAVAVTQMRNAPVIAEVVAGTLVYVLAISLLDRQLIIHSVALLRTIRESQEDG